MGKKKKLKPDTVLKQYWRDNEHFADFFNAVLFQGNSVIQPDELEELDTEESSVLEHRNYAESVQASRDVVKVRKKSIRYKIELVILGMESQEHIHYAMSMRLMGYDYGAYKKQYDVNAKKYTSREGLEEDEYLSRMKKTDKFIPVITVVVYYGEKPWDGATSLHGMLDIAEELKHYVNDYKMLLVEARQNNLVLHNINNRDLFQLLGILLDKSKPIKEIREKAIEYANEHKVDKSVIMTASGVANCNIDYQALDKEGAANMYTVFEETRKEGKREGEAKGKREGEAKGIIETGLEFGLSEQEILERLQRKVGVSAREAEQYFRVFGA